jgi:hypothetical protein
MPFNQSIARRAHTLESNVHSSPLHERVFSMEGQPATATMSLHHPLDQPPARWAGYQALSDPSASRGWMPSMRCGEGDQARAKAQHAGWVASGPAEARNRLGPLKPHLALVTPRAKRSPHEPSFEQTYALGTAAQVSWAPHSPDGLVSQTANLDYGSFSLPERGGGHAGTGLVVPDDTHDQAVPLHRQPPPEPQRRSGAPAAVRAPPPDSPKATAAPPHVRACTHPQRHRPAAAPLPYLRICVR